MPASIETPAETSASRFAGNEDLAPVPLAGRTWTVWSMAALWISMSACIPTYMLASSLIGGGMNWWQAVLTIFLGNGIVFVPMVLNVVSPANDFAQLSPRHISFRTGGLITGLIGIAIMPWKLVADPSGYIFTWLVGYSALLGPIGGILIADYFVLRRCQLNVPALYEPWGEYHFTGGYSVVAILCMVLAVLPSAPGFLVNLKVVDAGRIPPVLIRCYDYAWFIGFGVAFGLYVVLRKMSAGDRVPI